MSVLKRILDSKKAIYAAVPVVATVVASLLGYDPTSIALLVLDAVFAILLVVQAILDIKYGSTSDGSMKK